MAVPNIFGSATAAIPLSQLDTNFATPVTIGNTAVQLGNTVTSFGNVTLTNVTISSGNVTVSAGSNTSPSITTVGDTNTGIFFPAADTIAFSEGGVESMRIDASGNLGIGTSSPTQKLDIVTSTAGAFSSRIYNSATTGTSYAQLQLQTDSSSFYIYKQNSTNTGSAGAGSVNIYEAGAFPMAFYTNATERMRIDSSGNLLVGTTSGLGTERLSVLRTVDSGDYVAVFKTTAATATNNYGTQTVLNGDPNDATRLFLSCIGGASTTRAQILSNGGLANYSANNVNLSDERTKTNIVNAGSYLAKICAIPVRTFKYKDQTDSLLNLGVIAQEVEAIAPELVDTTGFGETPDDGIPLKSIYQTDLQYALMKCIQEMKTIIDQQAERIAVLEAK